MRLETMPTSYVQPTLRNALRAMWLLCTKAWGEYRAEARIHTAARRASRWTYDTRSATPLGRLWLRWEHLWCRPWLSWAMTMLTLLLCWATVDLLCHGPLSLYVITRFG